MLSLGPWSNKDFEGLSWHDVHVHGLRFAGFNEVEGAADIVFDTDYILKWEKSGNQFLFTVCRAELTFHSATSLKLELDYLTPAAGMCPFVISQIERIPLHFPNGYESFRWHIHLNWPNGLIEFQSPSFTQVLVGEPVVQPMQQLSTKARIG